MFEIIGIFDYEGYRNIECVEYKLLYKDGRIVIIESIIIFRLKTLTKEEVEKLSYLEIK